MQLTAARHAFTLPMTNSSSPQFSLAPDSRGRSYVSLDLKPALVAIVFIATAGITAPADFTANDLVGAWTLGVADKNYAYYTFRSDHTYNGSEGDMLFEGKWRVVGRSRLKKILLTGSRFELIVIDSFA